MGSYFLDSSAVVKRFVAESGSAWVADLMDPARANRLYVARIAGVEVVAALARRAAQPGAARPALLAAITDFRAEFLRRFNIVELAPALVAAAMDIAERHVLRGYDAVQLAAATQVHREYLALGLICPLISADTELNAAAIAEGLTVETPVVHP